MRPRAGFTLLELMVALVIGGITLSGATALYLGLSSRADAIRATSLAVSHDANAERLLRRLAVNAEGRREAPGVRGDSAAVTLDTWCETPFGWSEPCRVRLAFRDQGRFRRLALQRADSTSTASLDEVVLRDSLSSGRFTYLVDASDGGSWSETWMEEVPPPAFAVVMETDTLLLPIH
jgi:prepilin-type N-terminal cleavage/methylation domain-containing protein